MNNPVSFTGMLVDLEPYGAFSSQLFFDAMSFGIQGGCRVLAPRTTRMTARYINFARNTRSTLRSIHTSWPASRRWCGRPRSRKPADCGSMRTISDALRLFSRSCEDDDVIGLTVRWNAYRTLYFDSLVP